MTLNEVKKLMPHGNFNQCKFTINVHKRGFFRAFCKVLLRNTLFLKVVENEEAKHIHELEINDCFDFLIGYAKEGLDKETTIDGLRDRLTYLRTELINLRNRYNNEVI